MPSSSTPITKAEAADACRNVLVGEELGTFMALVQGLDDAALTSSFLSTADGPQAVVGYLRTMLPGPAPVIQAEVVQAPVQAPDAQVWSKCYWRWMVCLAYFIPVLHIAGYFMTLAFVYELATNNVRPISNAWLADGILGVVFLTAHMLSNAAKAFYEAFPALRMSARAVYRHPIAEAAQPLLAEEAA